MKATTLIVLALSLLTLGSSAQGGSVRQKPMPEKTSVEYGSAERTRLLDQLHGSKKDVELDRLGSVARRAALSEKRYKGQKHVKQRRTRR